MTPNRQAAVAYFIYGMIYLVGGILALDQARMDTRGGRVPLWVYYALGTAFAVGMPALIWFAWGKVMRWVGLVLGVMVAAKGAYLLVRPTPYRIFWTASALVAAALLIRAFWLSRPGAAKSPARI
ncbi:MAG: hypothetical protein ACI9WU_001672 [Myxococcota bacterium]|jgi:hypothetical protein